MRNDKKRGSGDDPEHNEHNAENAPDEDLVFDADDMTDDEPDTGAAALKLKKVKEKLKECEHEKGEYLDGWQRAKADLVNYTRLQRDETERKVNSTVSGMLSEILPVADSFDMAMMGEGWQLVDKNWRIGVEQIASQLKSVLRGHGVEEVDPSGAQFDPSAHECVSIAPTENESEDGIVLSVVQKGYIRKGVVLRPARVVVGQYTPSSK